MAILPKEFFLQDTIKTAKNLLGCKLIRNINNEKFEGMIVETEAYTQDDPACHAFRGLTQRTAPMFKEGGVAYVYFIYGMYHCMNVVTGKENTASGVLIRALEPIPPLKNTNGPGKLCKSLQINKSLNETNLRDKNSGLWLEKFREISPDEIITTTRIGIKQAAEYPRRFYIKDNPHVSKK